MLKKTISLVLTLSVLVVSNAFAYIGNTNSYKFHNDYCRAAAKIRPHNKIYIETREEAINAGFVPCKICNP